MKLLICFFIIFTNFIQSNIIAEFLLLNDTTQVNIYADQKVLQITDSTSHLESWIKQQQQLSLTYLLRNINPPGTKVGFIAASPSTQHPNYFFTWIRDASLVTNVLVKQYYNKTGELEDILLDYVDFQLYTQQTIADAPCQCLGEPKYNADGSPYKGDWGRPQFDQIATRAMTMIQITNSYQSQGNDLDYILTKLVPSIYMDLDSIVNIWMVPCFDLWEEIKGIHFYTLMVMRNGLLDGSDFAKQYNDIKRAHLYRHTARKIEDRLHTFWSSKDNYIKVTQNQVRGLPKPSGLDISVILASNLVTNRNDGFFTPGSDKILATASILEDAFANLYPLNKRNVGKSKKYGVSLGRYPEDVYDGYTTTTLGNPWFLATTAMTELYYLAMKEWKQQKRVEVNWINHEFFKKRDPLVELGHVYELGQPDFDVLLQQLALDADQFLATVQYHTQANGALSEQFNRENGFQQGAMDLSWSYSSFLSAIYSRSQFLEN
ncbi:glucoamylase [Cunninghamella echinulata]|nr:glucoamylase [Cunninghamella echinulata]